jgi:MCRA family
MYYSSGNYEAFARPRKPDGVENKSAWFVGSGLAALAGAAFLIRDGQMPGHRITLLEQQQLERLGHLQFAHDEGGEDRDPQHLHLHPPPAALMHQPVSQQSQRRPARGGAGHVLRATPPAHVHRGCACFAPLGAFGMALV